MRIALGAAVFFLSATVLFAQSPPREKLATDTPKSALINMDPARIDPSNLALDRIDQVQTTGTPQKIDDISSWRLTVKGSGLAHEASITYKDLVSLPLVKKNVLLICPGFFAGYVEWEGVPLRVLLERLGAATDYKSVSFQAYDGYSERFSRKDVMEHLFLLAVKASGTILPPEHGYPVRLVAEDFYGGRWVKWITEIHLD